MRSSLALFLLIGSSLIACTSSSTEDEAGGSDAISSAHAKIVDFEFAGEVVTASNVDARNAIVSQLMYVQGILTTSGNGNGHVGNVRLADVAETSTGDKKRVTYKATLPVAWPKNVSVPQRFELALPNDTTRFDAFNAKYDGRCGANVYGQDTFWHDWNPKASACRIDDGDVVRARATVTPSTLQSTRKYPEYDLIWQDDRLDVVAVFGIIGATPTPSDKGFAEAARFLGGTEARLRGARVSENPTSSSILMHSTLTGKTTVAGRARDVKVDVIVVQELASVGADFDSRYDVLSEKADMILYNGHAGLGKNVNALARKGRVTAGKYQLVLLNGCQTFAYIDTTLTDRRREANGASDPTGTRFLDVVGNALPGYVNNLASMSVKLVDAAIDADQPKSYGDLLAVMPKSHIVVVFGEEDNAFSR